MIARTTYGQSRPWRAGARALREAPHGGRAGEPGGDEEEIPTTISSRKEPRISSVRMSHASFAAGRVSRSETSESTM